jgi:uncharacterized membrane protein
VCKNLTSRKSALSLAVLLLASVPLALAQGTYAQIDVPGATGTVVYAVDTIGDLAGWYVDYVQGIFYQHGFLLSGATYTTAVDYPGSSDTILLGMNDLGQVVGTGFMPEVGFLYDVASQTFTTVSYPGATTTEPFAINNARTIAGDVSFGTTYRGFDLVGSRYRPIWLSGAARTYVTGIGASGELLVSGLSQSGGVLNFLFNQGKYQRIVVPHAPGAEAVGISPAGGTLVGFYYPSSGGTAGFLYQNKTLTTLQFPGSNTTEASGVNDAGVVAGYFYDSFGVAHGFTWTPPADAAKK